VDGNVVRVLCRLFALRGDPTHAPLKRRLWEIAAALVPAEAPGDFNQALMELGATVCTPRSPVCERCPVSVVCRARSRGLAEKLPELPQRRATVAVSRAAAVVFRKGKVLVEQVPPDARRWPGFWKFPSVNVSSEEKSVDAALRAVRDSLGAAPKHAAPLLTVRHSVTHYRITLDVFRCTAPAALRARDARTIAWRAPDELDELPMPTPDRRIAKHLLTSG
jgi:A/G-specific adenine glycosylase